MATTLFKDFTTTSIHHAQPAQTSVEPSAQRQRSLQRAARCPWPGRPVRMPAGRFSTNHESFIIIIHIYLKKRRGVGERGTQCTSRTCWFLTRSSNKVSAQRRAGACKPYARHQTGVGRLSSIETRASARYGAARHTRTACSRPGRGHACGVPNLLGHAMPTYTSPPASGSGGGPLLALTAWPSWPAARRCRSGCHTRGLSW